MKQCLRCHELKPLDLFPNWKKGSNVCKPCHNVRRTAHRRKDGVKTRQQRNAYMREYRERNRDEILSTKAKLRKANPLAALWRQISRSNRSNGFTITREQFFAEIGSVPKLCPVLGIPISYDLEADNFPSVDRIDPNRPYESGNVAVISYRANMIKSIGSAREHRAIAEWLDQFCPFEGRPIRGAGPRKVGSNVLTFGRERQPIIDGVRAISASAETACCR